MSGAKTKMTTDKKPAGLPQAASGTEQYLSFLLGGEEYGVDIQKVQEIKGWDTVTRVPYSPPYVLGVINLRGSIVPVIDLRLRFGLEKVPHDATTVIIVVHVPGDRGERTVGMVVDAVADVYDVAGANTNDIDRGPGGACGDDREGRARRAQQREGREDEQGGEGDDEGGAGVGKAVGEIARLGE